MYTRLNIFTLCLILTIAVLFFGLMIRTNESDFEAYQELIKSCDKKDAKQMPLCQTSQQQRDIQRDLFFTQKGKRLHSRLSSVSASIAFKHTGKEVEIVEECLGVQGIVQQELLDLSPHEPAMQMLLHIAAEKAEYDFSHDRLIAQNAIVGRYCLPGHQLMQIDEKMQPLMQSKAKEIEFSLSQSGEGFKARGLSAIILDKAQ